MSVYSERDVKTKAIVIFLYVISEHNKAFGERLEKHKEELYSKLLAGIQKHGIHDYAYQVLKRGSSARKELDELIELEESYDG